MAVTSVALTFVAQPSAYSQSPKTISTMAGTGQPGFNGDNSDARKAQLNNPMGMWGQFITDTNNYRIRLLSQPPYDPSSISTWAGSGTKGFSGDDGPPIKASFASPSGIVGDNQGNLYVADRDNNRIRAISISSVRTVAGSVPGFGGDGGAASAALLNVPTAVALDSQRNLYVADSGNRRIRKIDVGGVILTIAGTGQQGTGKDGEGGPAISARLDTPSAVAVDSAGNVYFADSGTHLIRKITATGAIATVAGTGVSGFSGDGGPSNAAMLSSPAGILVAPSGYIYISDTGNHRVRRIGPDGVITTVAGGGPGGSADAGYAGDGGPAVSARLNTPIGLYLDYNSNLHIADSKNHRMRRVQSLELMPQWDSPAGFVGYPYSGSVWTYGGESPYVWSLADGSLPPGIVISSSGSLGGSPAAAGNYLFTLRVTDAHKATALLRMRIVVESAQPLLISTPNTIPPALLGVRYSFQLSAQGGTPPYRWSCECPGPTPNPDGSLPDGIFAGADGLLTGKPAQVGPAQYLYTVQDSVGALTTKRFFQDVLPAVPQVTISGLADSAAPADQPVVGVNIASAYTSDISGTLTLSFTPDASQPVDDPMIQFSTGGRTANFSISANKTQATFGGGSIAVQTGTVAGVITLTVSLTVKASSGAASAPSVLSQSVRISRSPPVLRSATITNLTASAFQVEVVGFSTPRALTEGVFQFSAKAGANLQTSQLRVSLDVPATVWFSSADSAKIGSLFKLVQSFSVQGDVSAIGSVSVVFSNQQGSSVPVTGNF